MRNVISHVVLLINALASLRRLSSTTTYLTRHLPDYSADQIGSFSATALARQTILNLCALTNKSGRTHRLHYYSPYVHDLPNTDCLFPPKHGEGLGQLAPLCVLVTDSITRIVRPAVDRISP